MSNADGLAILDANQMFVTSGWFILSQECVNYMFIVTSIIVQIKECVWNVTLILTKNIT